VIEKPAVTTSQDLDQLEHALQHNPRLLMGFHKRHSLLHTWMTQDLQLEQGHPAHYHCIVHEVPLPSSHWYTWPNSRSRLISNGCHWIDEFLWINPTQDVVDAHVHQAPGVLNVWLTLSNGATFTMTLSEHGSSRLGVREVVEVRAADRTARIWDGAHIQTEDGTRVLRDAKINPMDAYPRMVSALSEIIEQDAFEQAEPPNHFKRLNMLVLKLDGCVERA
jgi:predicted dehydrogenase